MRLPADAFVRQGPDKMNSQHQFEKIFSVELFPPRTESGFEKLRLAVDELQSVSPAFFSVTYGAGGTTRDLTRDAVATPQFDSRLPVIPVRALKNVGTSDFGRLQLDLLRKLEDSTIDRTEAQYEVERFWMGALKNAVVDGDMKKGSLMAGQSVGLADKILPLQGIFDELVSEAEAEMQRLSKIFSS